MNKEDKYLLDLKDCVIIDEFVYRDLIYDTFRLRKSNGKLHTIIEKCINYITDDDRELSVDCHYKFKDLCEFDDLYKILEEYKNE